jgi:hypothetical protein
MLDPQLRQQAERFEQYSLSDTLCRAPQTLRLPTPPLSASLSGEVVGGTGATAAPALRLDPALRRLGFYANRLGAAPEVLELLIEVPLAMGGEVIFTQPCILKCTRWCIDDFTVHG